MTSNRNIGIVAHVDAGKTTLTEQILHAAGVTRKAGSVDEGTSATDSLGVERARGISVRLATESFTWQGCQIHLIDTPGHVDFSAEVERSLRALDCAILVVSAVEGVQANTAGIFAGLKALGIPTLVFINKLDRAGASVEAVMAEIAAELSPDCLLLQRAEGEGTSAAGLGACWSEAALAHAQAATPEGAWIDRIVEKLTEYDDGLLEQVILGETPGFAALDAVMVRAIREGRLYPVLTGIAKQAIGIRELLDAVVHYLPEAVGDPEGPLSAVVFKIEHDKRIGKMAYLRVFSGTIRSRERVVNATRSHGQDAGEAVPVEDKVGQVKRVQRGKYQDIEAIAAGEIGVVSGLVHARVGDVLGDGAGVPNAYQLSAPILTARVVPGDEQDFGALAAALSELAEEDPLLALEWLVDERELHVTINGWIQVEVLEAILAERFGLKASFEPPAVIYRETPIAAAEGYERYWMPKPCWAIVRFLIEPGEPGSGVRYASKVSVNEIAAKYQNEIEATLGRALKQGPKGWEVTDVRITLIEGSHHVVHSKPGDFIVATPMAIINGLVEADTQLLEPMLAFQVSAHADLLGAVTSDVTKMRGHFETPTFAGERFTLKGRVPAATSLEYAIELASMSGGNAKWQTRFAGYEPCALEHGATTPIRGISPLDRDKYILWARGAIR